MDLPTVEGGRGPRFLRHTGTVVVLGSDVAGAGAASHPPASDPGGAASLLLATGDFDPGGAPTTAAEALASRGIRAVIAPGFERSFYESSFAQGILPAIVTADAVERLKALLAARPDTLVTVDLESSVIECDDVGSIPFDVDPRGRNKLLLGLTDFDEMKRHSAKTAELRATDRERRPWLYPRS